jgi:hypothetical protein
VRDEAPAAVIVFHEHSETTGYDEKERLVIITIAGKCYASWQTKPAGFGQQPAESNIANRIKEPEAPQMLAKFVRIAAITGGTQ